MKFQEVPDHIKDVKDSIINEIFVCEDCGRNYKIIQQELQFYRNMILPLPRKCFFCRHIDRLKRRGVYQLFDRICAKCGKDIKTIYSPKHPEIVYCEQCYQQEVV
jgi:CxxC-x17-CxxC domain-containing protein